MDLSLLTTNRAVRFCSVDAAAREIKVYTELPPLRPNNEPILEEDDDDDEEPDPSYLLFRAIWAVGHRTGMKMYWRTIGPDHRFYW
jgi:hypothetical protein